MRVPVSDDIGLDADIGVPTEAGGVVVFAHGSGSSRQSPRNRHVAAQLQRAGLGTVLVDLLTPEEEQVDRLTAELRFNIGLLGERLTTIVDWVEQHRDLSARPIGLFGASTGAAAALETAAARPKAVRAVVSRGGRPDLAADALATVEAPTLLIVGGNDPQVLELNQQAQRRMHGKTQLRVVRDATHLFEEPGALDQVAELAREWFVRHLAEPPAALGDV